MLRLRSFIHTHLLPAHPAAHLASPLRRLLSAAASPSPEFAVEQYLVATCGLTRAQALKSSPKLSHLKSPANPDAVLAFLAGLGLSGADAAAVVAKDPQFLCAGVDRTLAPIVADLAGLGFSRAEMARLVSLAPSRLRCRSVVANLRYHLSLYGSCENLLRVIRRGSYLLTADLERAVKPNVAFLRECGLGASDITKLCIALPRMLSTNTERVRAMVARAEGLGVPRGSGLFTRALHAVQFLGEERVAAKLDYLKDTFRWSDAEVRTAVCRFPLLLAMSKDTLRSKSEFLVSEAGLEPAYIARHPVMVCLCLEGRLRPRYCVVKFLKENGLLDHGRSYYSSLMPTEKVFMEKYIHPYKGTAPCLAEDYAAACRGEVPTRFRFT